MKKKCQNLNKKKIKNNQRSQRKLIKKSRNDDDSWISINLSSIIYVSLFFELPICLIIHIDFY